MKIKEEENVAHLYQFTYKTNINDRISKDYKTNSLTAMEALKSFYRDRPGCVLIAMWNNNLK